MSEIWLEGFERKTFDFPYLTFTSTLYRLVLHSTETPTGRIPAYQGGTVAPQFTYDFTLGSYQHVPANYAGRALQNLSGGSQTNRHGAIQVEIVGSCDPRRKGDSGYVYLPDLSDDDLLRLYDECLEPIMSRMGIKFDDYGLEWVSYPESYASPNLTAGAWAMFDGVCGHQHVPENVHGDPGAFPFKRMMQIVNNRSYSDWLKDMTWSAEMRNDFVSAMRLAVQDPFIKATIAKAVLDTQNTVTNSNGDMVNGTDKMSLGQMVTMIEHKADTILGRIESAEPSDT